MKFSIIVPIYKVEEYIERCVTSLIEQTYPNIEIILVDDGSPDNCPKICDNYAKKDSRIKVIHKVNGGLSDARNAGLKIATGDYIIFVDSDDYVNKNMCEQMLEYAKKNYDVIIGDAIVEGGKINLEHICTDKVLSGKEYLLYAHESQKAPMAVWLNIYNRDFLNKNRLRFKYGILHEDEEFTPRVFLKARSVFVTKIPFYHYIIRDNSITTKKDKRKNAKDFYDTCIELEKIYNTCENQKLREYLLDSLVVKYLNIYQVGKLFKYGKEYTHKEFCVKNAFVEKTKVKSRLFYISPVIYWYVNNMIKRK